MPSTLYICYFGLREPLVQTQVLPYLRQLAAGGIRVFLLTFEPQLKRKWGEEAMRAERERLAAQGVEWRALAYHKSPSLPATVYDIAAGALAASRLVREHDIDVVHGRSHVAAAVAAAVKRLTGRPFIFDIRGFLPEEYVDAGVWPEGGRLYRVAKRVERRLLDAADGFVVLTEKARDILFPGHAAPGARPVEVIPCCVDMSRFRAAAGVSREEVRRELGVEGRRVVVYVGALGGWYLTEETAELLAAAHAEDAKTFSLVLTQSPPEMIAGPLRARGVKDSDFLVRKVAPPEVPRYLKAADLAVSFIKPCYSKLSSSPTKLAEYLAAGLPVVCNAGIGDVDAVVESERVGVIVRELGRESYGRALSAVEELRREGGLEERCRDAAARRFDLETVGGESYRRLYRRVLGARAAALAPARGRRV
ncbi:MAG TPA: glycosyltransferase [Pyrinomonadaceae bacterium]|nr:glycosyltransferase [Pyrinomonadaceae bacterium]